MILSGALMLRHLGYPDAADRLEAAVRDVIAEGRRRPTTWAARPARRLRRRRSSSADSTGVRAAAAMTGIPASLRPPRKPRRHRARRASARRGGATPGGSAPGVQGILFTICATYLFISGILLTPLFGTPYEVDGYLSPLFSPLIAPDWLPTWISPGLLILWIPLGFRATCYYYRKAYYRFYFADPPGCAVGEPTIHRRYAMETAFPFILQNLHRYFLYLAFIPLFFLWVDAVASLRPRPAARTRARAASIFFVNVVLLTGYSLSCHSLRHLVGGRLDCFSCTRRASRSATRSGSG